MFIQIFLSSVAFAHDVTCQSSSNFIIPCDNLETTGQQTISCRDCHKYEAETENFSDTDHLEISHRDSPLPCTCSSSPTIPFINGDFSADTRERKISLVPINFICISRSFLIIPSIPSLNGVLGSPGDDIGLKDRLKLIHIPQYSGRFVSTHLSKFLL